MAANMYLKCEEPKIEGESTDAEHKGEIQVLSWSHSSNQPTSPTRSSAGGATVEAANHSDFTITKYTDATTSHLLEHCWSGKMIKTCTFIAYRANDKNKRVKYLEIVMSNVVISNVSFGGGTGDLPTETVALNYGVIEFKYIQQKKEDDTAGSPIPVKHDLINNVVA